MEAQGSDGGPAVTVVVPAGNGAEVTATAFAADGDCEVLLALSWPAGTAPVGAPPAVVVVHAAGAGAAGAVNAALAVARGRVVLLCGPGDMPGVPDLARAHAACHATAAGAAVVVGSVAGNDPVATGWVGRLPAGAPALPARHLSIDLGLLRELGGLDERLHDLDVAALDLLQRAAEQRAPLLRRPDLVLRGAQDSALERAEHAGRSAQALDHLMLQRGQAWDELGSPRSRAALRAMGPALRAAGGSGDRRLARLAVRSAFARGRGLPRLPTEETARGGISVNPSRDRPPVAVVVPFAGDAAQAALLLGRLDALRRREDDEVVVVDNGWHAAVPPDHPGVRVVRADDQHSSYFARNAGARATSAPWILFVDDDCVGKADILDRFFAPPPDDGCGAVAGAVLPPPRPRTIAERHAADAGVLSQARSLHHGFKPYAVTANLLVRRTALERVGGFAEGIRSGGDADFCWRLQDAGWSLGWRPQAAVVHEHRSSLRALLRQHRRYGAGIAWLAGRHAGAPSRIPVRPSVSSAARDLVLARPSAARTHGLQALVAVSAWRGARDGNDAREAPAAESRLGALLATLVTLARLAARPDRATLAVAVVGAVVVKTRLGARMGSLELPLVLTVGGKPHTFWVADRSELEVLADVLGDNQYVLDLDAEDDGAIVDLGANIGAATVFFARSHPGRRVLAVEPDPVTVGRLRRTVAGLPRVDVVEAAVSGSDGVGVLHREASASWASSLMTANGNGDAVSVNTRTLRRLLDEAGLERVAVLKMDVEGAEYEVLRHLSSEPRVQSVVAELHDFLPGARPDEEIRSWLEGFEVEFAVHGRDRQVRARRATTT